MRAVVLARKASSIEITGPSAAATTVHCTIGQPARNGMPELNGSWDERRASFETAASRPPQDQVLSSMQSKFTSC